MDKRLFWLVCTISLAGCMQRTDAPAPVLALSSENRPQVRLAHVGVEKARVRPGDTLAIIASRYGISTEKLARINNLKDPNRIMPGQMLALHEDPDLEYVKRRPLPPLPHEKSSGSPSTSNIAKTTDWGWPTQGPVLQKFSSESNRKKGIEIGGSLKQPIVAAQDGVVVYKGTGIRGYGQLVILKHKDHYLTAYGHTDSVLVEEGASVKRGEKIALMGEDDSKPKLHFEVRHYGKPLDPLNFLTKT